MQHNMAIDADGRALCMSLHVQALLADALCLGAYISARRANMGEVSVTWHPHRPICCVCRRQTPRCMGGLASVFAAVFYRILIAACHACSACSTPTAMTPHQALTHCRTWFPCLHPVPSAC